MHYVDSADGLSQVEFITQNCTNDITRMNTSVQIHLFLQ